MTIYSGDEQTIWEGETQNVTALATGGRFTLRYRLTTHNIYFEHGGITGTRQEQIPLINVQDVDVSQTLIQKTRKIGNVLVHIVRPNGRTDTAVFDSIFEPERVRDLINQTVHQVRAAAHQRQLAEQRDLNVHRFETESATFPPTALSGNSSQPTTDPDKTMEMLERLGKLRDAGVVTPEEFEAKKKDLLDRL
jgi:Short C-terminal domain/Bacterial PH domain